MFGKFMNKKFFHPSSYPNQKQKWIHQQRADAKEKQENEKKETYMKEQESYQSRMLSAKTKEEKMKLDLNFLYDVPPGMKKDDPNEEEEVEVKFEWQKNAPRSKYLKDLGLACQDQPFGICVKNIRCFKCRQWGHQNTDRECPLFFSNMPSDGSTGKSQADSLRLSDPLRLVADMKKQHGITLKKSVIGQEIDPMAEHNQLLESDDDDKQKKSKEKNSLVDNDLQYIASLSNKEKKKLLKTLNKFEKSVNKKKKRKRKRRNSEDGSSENEWMETKPKLPRRKQKRHRSSRSPSLSEEDRKYQKKHKQRGNRNVHREDKRRTRHERDFSEGRYSDTEYRRERRHRRESRDTYPRGDFDNIDGERTHRRNDDDRISRMISECRGSQK
ncbi:corepressor interacting with RBPJ 1-like [Clytia hemisphaerica]|uniref:CBF1-interacting co-repressor CIR N-terminal domain-containing protein n=1 Tax=Clytia hemisphaerica TaxID=252671 RepID=A0A7M5XAP8_9CNID|eukprot:TCONS_00043014-protein